jgi:hypothetical protein
VAYLGDGMRDGQWAAATLRHYGIADLSALQTTWLAWVAGGSPPLKPADLPPLASGQGPLLAANGRLPRPEPNLIYRTGNQSSKAPVAGRLVPVDWDEPVAARQPPLRSLLSRPQPAQQPRQIILERSPQVVPREVIEDRRGKADRVDPVQHSGVAGH